MTEPQYHYRPNLDSAGVTGHVKGLLCWTMGVTHMVAFQISLGKVCCDLVSGQADQVMQQQARMHKGIHMSSEELGDKLQRINVLSIDGGGIRGIIPAMVLAEIESRTGKNACQLFDIITGTSTGGILALGLAKPMSTVSHEPAFTAAQLVDLYEKYGRAIFPQSIWRKIGTWFRAQYPVSGLEKLLEEYFGDSRLSDALTRVVVTSYDIENRKAFFFRSVRAQTAALQRDYDYPMKSVARATSAAPTYFEPGRISRDASAGYWALIDGGVFANNPAMCAYVEALEMNPNAEIPYVPIMSETTCGWKLGRNSNRQGVENASQEQICQRNESSDGPRS